MAAASSSQISAIQSCLAHEPPPRWSIRLERTGQAHPPLIEGGRRLIDVHVLPDFSAQSLEDAAQAARSNCAANHHRFHLHEGPVEAWLLAAVVGPRQVRPDPYDVPTRDGLGIILGHFVEDGSFIHFVSGPPITPAAETPHRDHPREPSSSA